MWWSPAAAAGSGPGARRRASLGRTRERSSSRRSRRRATPRAVAEDIGGLGDPVRRRPAGEASTSSSTRPRQANGPIDVFFTNAGVPGGMGGLAETDDAAWDLTWRVNVMAHAWAGDEARGPEMAARGEGYLVNTASAAGLLTQISSVSYSVTKHCRGGPGRVDLDPTTEIRA